MPNITNLLSIHQRMLPKSHFLVYLLLSFGLITGGKCVAATPQNPPAELTNLLTQLDTAANQGDIKSVVQFYSPNFTQDDGLNRQMMEQALVSLWKQYPHLKYSTQLESWQPQGNAIIADTLTTITGTPSASNNNMAMTSTIKTRSRIVGGKILHQDIISERNQITSGATPPQIDFRLPQQVKVNQTFNLDAIVQQPLNEDFLLGTAIEEPVQPNKYLKPTQVNLDLLSSGGIFKVGRAPSTPGSEWLSAVVLRQGGMTIITQRMQVVR